MGDAITGFAVFDSALVAPVGSFFLRVDDHPAFQLSFAIGGFTFSAADDFGYGLGYPVLAFQDALLTGFEFLAPFRAPLDNLVFDVVGGTVLVTDDDDGFRQVAAGVLTTFRPPPAASVPEPAVLPLFAIGAALLARRWGRSTCRS